MTLPGISWHRWPCSQVGVVACYGLGSMVGDGRVISVCSLPDLMCCNQLYPGQTPNPKPKGGGLVYDYQIYFSRPPPAAGSNAAPLPFCELRPWSESVPPFTYRRDLPFFQMLVPTVDTVRYAALLELCLGVDRSVLLSGGTGVGKSVMMQAALVALSDTAARGSKGSGAAWGAAMPRGAAKEVVAHTIVFSAQTSSLDTQLLMEAKLEKKRKNR